MDRCDSERAGPIPGVQSADEVPGIGKAQPTCLRQSTALAPGPPGQSRQRPDQRDRGGPLAQHVLLRQGDRHLRFGPFHLRRAGRHPPGHDRVEDIAVVGNLLAPARSANRVIAAWSMMSTPCSAAVTVQNFAGPQRVRSAIRAPNSPAARLTARSSALRPSPRGIGKSDRVEVPRQGQQ
ncbi:hypothetical protein ACK1X7_37410 [Streptomyces sp. CY1]|uniref:hypothetical protein n=1 Tax=Streptomyces sp. CY1 TaxID=3388313 RepID=UPI0039A36B01